MEVRVSILEVGRGWRGDDAEEKAGGVRGEGVDFEVGSRGLGF